MAEEEPEVGSQRRIPCGVEPAVIDRAVDAAESLWIHYPHPLSDFRTDITSVVCAAIEAERGLPPEPGSSPGLGELSRGSRESRERAEEAKRGRSNAR